jgi:hypothetical protein
MARLCALHLACGMFMFASSFVNFENLFGRSTADNKASLSQTTKRHLVDAFLWHIPYHSILKSAFFMQQHPSDASSTADSRAATIKLVFKKALLSKLGHSTSNAAEISTDVKETVPETPKTTEKKTEKKATANGTKNVPKAISVPSKSAAHKASPSKSSPAKSSHKVAAAKGVSKKSNPNKQKRSENNIDSSSITSELGRCVISSTAGLDLADSAGDLIPFSRVKRMMKEILGDLKLTNESVAALICSCHGFLSYMTMQVLLSRKLSL